MMPGFNTDFKYRGETYHVQTEDNGVGNPVVVTLLYHKGAILASRRTPYHDLIGRTGFEQELKGLMKNQHKDLMRALLAGVYDKNGAAPETAASSGKHPAAVAVAGTSSKPVTKPLPAQASVATCRDSFEALAAPVPATAPRIPVLLDEAIRLYLKEFAATTAATAR